MISDKTEAPHRTAKKPFLLKWTSLGKIPFQFMLVFSCSVIVRIRKERQKMDKK
jgi:hypothetical protein